jgi:hypothetical protein
MIVITDKDYLPIKEDVMSDEEIKGAGHHPADYNGDGKVTEEERDMYLSSVAENLKTKMRCEMPRGT